MAKALDCGPEVSEFKLQPHFYIPFRTNIFVKSMNPFITLTMG